MGRGRPKKPVPPPPASALQPTPISKTVTSETVNHQASTSSTPVVVGEKTPSASTNPKKEVIPPNSEVRKLWVDVLKDNRNPAKGRSMQFIAPKLIDGNVEVEIEVEDIESELDFWSSALILYVIGGELSMNALKNFMTRTWNFVQLPDMYYNDEGFFILRFRSFSDRDDVLMKGPYTIRNMPVLIREWNPDFKLKDDFLRTLPIWIKLPQLPLYLWGERSLNKIGSALGIPLVTDECTANKLRVSYARILVEMDITKELPAEITIRDRDGNKLQQAIEYEWKPLYCNRCHKPGHNCDQPKPKVKQWKPKSKPVETDKTESQMVVEETSKGVTTTRMEPEMKEKSDTKVESKWTEVNKSTKDRGKKPMVENNSAILTCTNGFDALQVLNDLQMLKETG
ncbi:uncharacterized protein LOC131605709 [Vicia villosa]|uniref:uncharacterized protein LOC131605709 n=1 Tax=Vicia villosa TaxID=3911 RepID=UPI00273AE54F|nr:uncharacterized protein LOC131605709 [Vicia villosa]